MGERVRSEPRNPVTAYVAIGANLGDAKATVLQAMDALDGLSGTHVTRRSSLYLTAALSGASGNEPDPAAPDYINAVVAIETSLTAPALLEQLQQLENAAGRERPYPHAPRTLDLDILLYGDAHVASPRLTVPHPRMLQRAFVLVPLAEIAPALVKPAQLSAVAGQVIERL
ncbi:MAG TPA: 2-amino-4-hydroxy-6-hydroxymethyldihydropteridine diphosphokinase [Polaromonas sp.]|uniref:2-amino-4-hydroxy-6- hydroxymethyldihydropteridine diphosphokinase n=1 Tax=Polaromonas sp. TaxID=1869339 RepID=UPI002D6F2C4C|nr:2-amino-4-hydroxy-6-hydroxymethyldihydropteridine diphosphokinase [Polaromonas sp.]HYW56064.1 2-amino-4-hydroxy-6-hydroxymethyldihydropteridine diphosphokinase [Polaromonas sp.]